MAMWANDVRGFPTSPATFQQMMQAGNIAAAQPQPMPAAPGGMLAPMQPAGQPAAAPAPAAPAGGLAGIMSGLGGGMGANANSLLYAGLGLLSGANRQQQMQGLMQGLQAGQQTDKAKRDEADKKAREAKAKEIAAGLWAGDPKMAGLAQAYPELAVQSYITRNQPKESWTDVKDESGAIVGQKNTLTQEYKPLPGTGPTDTQRNYTQFIREWQGDPANKGKTPPNLAQYQKELAAARSSNVTADLRGESEFSKTVGANQAKMFTDMIGDGVAAKTDLARIGQLRQLVANSPGGFQGGLQGLASQYGIKLGEKASDIEAAQALINQLVPQQRPPGSGTMSDRDVELFKQSLPSLWNTPGGNTIILDTMQSLAEYKAAQSQIANQVLAGRMTREQGLDALQSLPNPLAKANAGAPRPGAAQPGAAAPIDTSRPGNFRWNPQTGSMEPM